MQIYGRSGVLATLLMLLSVPIRAQDAATISDIRCVVVAIKLAEMPDATRQSAGMMAALYYLGRLEGRVPNLDIEELIIGQLSTMTTADYSSEAQRCGGGLTLKGQQITKIGSDLVKRGQKLQDQAAAPPKS
jgi:hypothetical protein